MDKFGKSQSVGRIKDLRFLTGTGRHVDDIVPDDALHAVFARSRAADVPMIGFDTEPVPSLCNPRRMKGSGKAGTVGVLGAVTNAVADTLACRGVEMVDMPCTPARAWRALNATNVAGQT